jgi:hypothetical protein
MPKLCLPSLLSTAATAACYYFKTCDWRHTPVLSLSPKKQPFSLSRYVIIVIIMRAYLFSAPLCLFAFINLIRKVSFVARIGFRFIICATFVAREETMRDVADPNQPRNKSTLLDKPNLIFVCEEKWQKAT